MIILNRHSQSIKYFNIKFKCTRQMNALGDYQTPLPLACQIISFVLAAGRWGRVLEPTCGDGTLLHALMETGCYVDEVCAVEIQGSHVNTAVQILEAGQRLGAFGKTQIKLNDIFKMKTIQWKTEPAASTLVLANPPWATRVKGRGLGGTANEDIGTQVMAHVMKYLAPHAQYVVICKTSTARALVRYAYDNCLMMNDVSMRLIDAKEYFNVKVAACLFIFKLGMAGVAQYQYAMYKSLNANDAPFCKQGMIGNNMISDIDLYRKYASCDGSCIFEWHCGIGRTTYAGDIRYPYWIASDRKSSSKMISLSTKLPPIYLAKHKVIVSSFYKKADFVVIHDVAIPDNGCYFLAFENPDWADVICKILNCDTTQFFLRSISFSDAQRPITQSVLQRINIVSCLQQALTQGLLQASGLLQAQAQVLEKLCGIAA